MYESTKSQGRLVPPYPPIHNSPLDKRWCLEEVMLSCIMQKSGIIACSLHFPMAKGSSSHIPNLSNHRWTNLMEYERPEMLYELRVEQWTNLGCLVYIGDSWAGIIFDYIYIFVYIYCPVMWGLQWGLLSGSLLNNQDSMESKSFTVFSFRGSVVFLRVLWFSCQMMCFFLGLRNHFQLPHVTFQDSKTIATHPDIAHPRQSPWPTMKGIPL